MLSRYDFWYLHSTASMICCQVVVVNLHYKFISEPVGALTPSAPNTQIDLPERSATMNNSTSEEKVQPPKWATIYYITEPNEDLTPGRVGYVGVTTVTIGRRLSLHIYESKNKGTNHIHYWIAKMMSEGKRPQIYEIETVPYDLWGVTEYYWWKWFTDNGYNLTNLRAGGLGRLYVSEETRRKISESKTGVIQSEETKKKRSESLTKTHCRRGHAMDDINTGIVKGTGKRKCLSCVKINNDINNERIKLKLIEERAAEPGCIF